ncbi:hypothetical protein ONE63_005716 [Megalurothrips usitatus]|uniref:Protein HEXIM-like n=1 Tax=Megalurothrips usitatus TaxID=439358 RepID=A0AAV7XWG8_9NEOP|nr:hypothetical protein ONE63_005716 [Megalurothrips usitatus]
MLEENTKMVCEIGPMRWESKERRKRHRRGKKRHTGRPAAVHPPDLQLSKSGGERGSENEDSFESGSEMSLLGSLTPKHVGNQRTPQPSLRPIIVPKAPENSTQFLIDDHEESSQFFNFEDNYKSPTWCGPMDDPDAYFPADCDEDEDAFSHMYYMRDFESEYQSAREEVLLDWSRELLFDEIQKLERKARTLEELLSLRDPYKYLASLQEQLIQLQEENRRLQAALRSDRSSSHSTSEDEVGPCQRQRADTASDLVMVVAPLSLQDGSFEDSYVRDCQSPIDTQHIPGTEVES